LLQIRSEAVRKNPPEKNRNVKGCLWHIQNVIPDMPYYFGAMEKRQGLKKSDCPQIHFLVFKKKKDWK